MFDKKSWIWICYNQKWKQKIWIKNICLNYLLENNEENFIFIKNELQLLVSCKQIKGLITTDKVWRQELVSSTCWCQNWFSINWFWKYCFLFSRTQFCLLLVILISVHFCINFFTLKSKIYYIWNSYIFLYFVTVYKTFNKKWF